MIHDAKVEVTCDGKGCRESIDVELPFTYPDYSGKGGRCDHRPAVVNKLVKREGWTVIGDDDDAKHFCENCAEDRDAEEEAG